MLKHAINLFEKEQKEDINAGCDTIIGSVFCALAFFCVLCMLGNAFFHHQFLTSDSKTLRSMFSDLNTPQLTFLM